NAQVHVHVQRVVVGDERLGCCATWNRVQHGGFHFKEPSCQHVLTDAADSLAACNKRTPGFLCHDEVDITLAVAQFLVGHAVKLVRQRAQRFGKQADGGGVNGQFTL